MESVYQKGLIGRLLGLHGDSIILSWRTEVSGPAFRPKYVCIAFWAGAEIGRGLGPSQETAKESAAARALAKLPQPPWKWPLEGLAEQARACADTANASSSTQVDDTSTGQSPGPLQSTTSSAADVGSVALDQTALHDQRPACDHSNGLTECEGSVKEVKTAPPDASVLDFKREKLRREARPKDSTTRLRPVHVISRLAAQHYSPPSPPKIQVVNVGGGIEYVLATRPDQN
ncbi:hypothetical protein HYDPIDRAFT_42205 [Hydnomerulius pinastri MD-312]|uniref:DRBM domain-containing protein n=1 Tax=Hydnomerulius pinastri MD-312 TaxID=994086 RepID=A0A0C9V960_9AGAM|nr:hypothetical protein HYDPIDRAFT_42205 [Hydnomerulius pinastri MD-312]